MKEIEVKLTKEELEELQKVLQYFYSRSVVEKAFPTILNDKISDALWALFALE